MAISKYTLHKYVKVDGTWRYRKAAYTDNGEIKPDIVFVGRPGGLPLVPFFQRVGASRQATSGLQS